MCDGVPAYQQADDGPGLYRHRNGQITQWKVTPGSDLAGCGNAYTGSPWSSVAGPPTAAGYVGGEWANGGTVVVTASGRSCRSELSLSYPTGSSFPGYDMDEVASYCGCSITSGPCTSCCGLLAGTFTRDTSSEGHRRLDVHVSMTEHSSAILLAILADCQLCVLEQGNATDETENATSPHQKMP